LLLHPAAGFTPVLHNLYSACRPVVCVPGEGMRAEIGNLYGGGTLDKTGAGELAIKSTGGEKTRVIVSGGSIELTGKASEELAVLLEKAALHLDASNDSTLTKVADADGLMVTRWDDVRKNGVYAGYSDYSSASVYFLPYCTNPLFRASATAKGMPLIDFGAKPGVIGRSNCVHKIYPIRITGVRAAFYVADHPDKAANAMVLGDLGGLQFMCGGNNTTLYDPAYSDPAVRYADITLNLKKTLFNGIDESDLTQLHVLGQNTLRDASVNLLGSREYYRSATGGTRLGEVILFTNELTRAERMLVARHLNAKWRADEADHADVESVIASGVAATVSVPSGKTAKIGTLASSAGLVKNGAGTLEVGALTPASGTVTVNSGNVAFSVPDLDDTTAADGAYIWLNAENVDTVEDNGTNVVKIWKDNRAGVTLTATTAYDESPHVPRLINSAVCNRQVVDFGRWNTSASAWDAGSDSAWMKLPNYATSSHYAYNYFCVMRIKNEDKQPGNDNIAFGMPLIWSTSMDSYHDGRPLVSANYRSVRTLAARWNINGVPVDPFTYASLSFASATNDFVLVSISATLPYRCDVICKDRPDSGGTKYWCGGFEIGELIMYDHPLTAEEHRDTEAYLMKKWLGKTHPAAAATLNAMAFGQSVTPVIDADGDVTISTLSGGTGDIVKRGQGDAVIGTIAVVTNVHSISVEEGSLSVSLGRSTFLNDALFHFDASDADSFTGVTVTEGVTNINIWADTRGNGITATANASGLATVKPKLVTVETRPGVFKPTVDFGALSWSTNSIATGEGVTVQNDSASMTFSSRYSVKEAFTVVADAHGTMAQSIFSDVYGTDAASHCFSRGEGGQLYYSNNVYEPFKASSVVRNALAYMDGSRAYQSTVIPAGFHSFSWICSQDGITVPAGWGGQNIGAFAYLGFKYTAVDTMIERCGGQYVSEQLGFNRLLTVDERAYVNALLNYKWFGGAYPGAFVTNRLASISVAAGSALDLKDNGGIVTMAATELSGAGEITVRSLEFSGTLNATIANGSSDCLTIAGTLNLGDVDLVVNEDTSAGKLELGDYPVLAATSLIGFDKRKWTVTANNGGRTYGLVERNNTVYLTLRCRGTSLLLR